MNVNDKVAVVTGGASGIGLALAEERFIISTHPWVLEKFAVKARDYDEYIAMMRTGRAAQVARTAGAT